MKWIVSQTSSITICNSFKEAVDRAYDIVCAKRYNIFQNETYHAPDENLEDIPKSKIGKYNDIYDDIYGERSELNSGKSCSITTKLLDNITKESFHMVNTCVYNGGIFR